MVPYEQVLRLNASADVLLATYDPSIPNNRYSSPNKVFEAMLLAKPIVVAENTNADRLVLSAGCGLAVPFGDAQALDQAFTRLAQNPALRAEMGQNGRRAYEDEYSWEKMRSRLTALYSQLRTEADQ
jgi:glycosyltransferase involved in cell wall biosynthesis